MAHGMLLPRWRCFGCLSACLSNPCPALTRQGQTKVKLIAPSHNYKNLGRNLMDTPRSHQMANFSMDHPLPLNLEQMKDETRRRRQRFGD